MSPFATTSRKHSRNSASRTHAQRLHQLRFVTSSRGTPQSPTTCKERGHAKHHNKSLNQSCGSSQNGTHLHVSTITASLPCAPTRTTMGSTSMRRPLAAPPPAQPENLPFVYTIREPQRYSNTDKLRSMAGSFPFCF